MVHKAVSAKFSHYTFNTFAQMALPASGFEFQLDNHMCTNDLN